MERAPQAVATAALAGVDLALLNEQQRDFPLVDRPFEQIGRRLGLTGPQVLARYRALQRDGRLSRIGAVWGSGAGGAAALCALAVPPARLRAVAATVNAHAGVNHNYEREHDWNLWFVVTGGDRAAVRATVAAIEAQTGLAALVLPMTRAYRIDLGFDLRPCAPAHARTPPPPPVAGVPVAPADQALAALAEQGLPLVARPYEAWGQACGRGTDEVLATLRRWTAQGTLRRFGVVVRHHELGFDCNAMTVVDVPDAQVDALGQAVAGQPGVTLAYRRERAPGWPYNLFVMVHGRERAAVRAQVQAALAAAGLDQLPHALLFSRQRFKQTGARFFRPATTPTGATP